MRVDFSILLPLDAPEDPADSDDDAPEDPADSDDYVTMMMLDKQNYNNV